MFILSLNCLLCRCFKWQTVAFYSCHCRGPVLQYHPQPFYLDKQLDRSSITNLTVTKVKYFVASWLDRNIKKVCRSYRDVRHVCNCRDKNRNHLKIIYKQFSRIEENLIGSKECLPIQIFDLKWNDSTFTKNIFFTKAPNWYNEMPKKNI